MKAKKLILAGDPKQLPPTVLSVPKRQKEKKASKITKDTKITSPAKEDISDMLEDLHVSDSDSDVPDAQAEDPTFKDTADVDDEELPKGLGDDADAQVVSPAEQKRDTSKLVPVRPPRSLETTLFDRLLTMHGPADLRYRGSCAAPLAPVDERVSLRRHCGHVPYVEDVIHWRQCGRLWVW